MDKESIEAIIVAAEPMVKEVAVPICKPAAKEAGEFLGILVGFLHTLVAPVERFNAKSRLKTKRFIEDVTREYALIPNENKQDAPMEIVGPMFEKLKYSVTNDDIREMYTKILVKSCDNRENDNIHPSFIDLVSDMNHLDCILFKTLYNKKDISPAAHVKFVISENEYLVVTPEWFLGYTLEEYSIFDISSSIIRLSILGLVSLYYNNGIKGYDYSVLENNELISSILKKYQSSFKIKIMTTESSVNINDFGKQFAKVVFD